MTALLYARYVLLTALVIVAAAHLWLARTGKA